MGPLRSTKVDCSRPRTSSFGGDSHNSWARLINCFVTACYDGSAGLSAGYAACVMISRVQGDPVMLSNRFTVAALATACIVAAGAGGYLASRQNATTPVPVAAASQAPVGTAAAPIGPVDRPVQETEGVVGDAPSHPAAATSPGGALDRRCGRYPAAGPVRGSRCAHHHPGSGPP